MRQRQLKRLWGRLKQLSTMQLTREELLMKLGAARDQSRICLAPGGNRGRRRRRHLQLSPRSRQTAASPLARGSISAAHQPGRGRPGQAVEPLSAAGCGRGSVQEPQGRPRDPAGLSPARDPRRGARLHRLSGLLPTHHADAAFARAGAGAHAAQRAGEVCRRADDRRAPADHRRPRAAAQPLHRARTRAQPVAEETQTGAARPTTPQDHRRARAANPAVVPTFGGRPKQSQPLRHLKVLESAKLG